jgi:hypothetical protein
MNPKNKAGQNNSLAVKEKRMLPFAVEFVKFFISFTIIIMLSLLVLYIVNVTMK